MMGGFMRKLVPLICIIVLLVSCSTTVSVPYMQPSVIDMGAYRNLAVASVVPYRGFSAPSRFVAGADIHAMGLRIYSGYSVSTASSVSEYATDYLYSLLTSTGFFNLLSPDITDAVLQRGLYGADISSEFQRLGYDAVLIPRITGMSVNETIYSEPYYEWWYDSDGVRHRRVEYNYYYRQIASIDYSLTIIDTETGAIVAQRTFSDSGKREGSLDFGWARLDDAGYLFRRMIRSFQSDIIRLLVPTAVEYNVSLMKNKPENKAAEAAYDAAKDGNLEHAESIFLDEWRNSRHLPSGYNAALLMAGTGNYDDAINLLSEINSAYSDADARSLYRDLVSIRTRNEQALQQVTGSGSVKVQGSDNANSVYAFVMGL